MMIEHHYLLNLIDIISIVMMGANAESPQYNYMDSSKNISSHPINASSKYIVHQQQHYFIKFLNSLHHSNIISYGEELL